MSPVRYVFVAGCKVYAVHHDDSHHLLGLGDGEPCAAQIAIGLAMLWHVEARRVNDDVLDVDEVLYRPDDVEAETVPGARWCLICQGRIPPEDPHAEHFDTVLQEMGTDVEGQLSMHDVPLRVVD